MRPFLHSIIKGERNDLAAWVVRIPLFLASLVYGLAVRSVVFLYTAGILPRRRLGVPVVSVGNLTVGGTGKTPIVIYLARMLSASQLRPVILTRGYMPRGSVRGSEFESDEAQVLREVLQDIPVVVNPDRYQGGLEAIERYKPDVLILDDGFQHWRLFRDLDIVLIDSADPFGNGQLLPCGILREPRSSLKRADLLVLTKTDRADTGALKDQLSVLCSGIPVVETVHRSRSLTRLYIKEFVNISHLSRPVVAFCGIGDPLSFKAMLVDLGADVKEFLHFLDHYAYGHEDMKNLRRICDELGVRTLITTRKDAVKLEAFEEFWQGYELFVLNIEIDIVHGQEHLINGINQLSHR